MSHVGPLKRTRPYSRGGFALRLLTAACAFCAASAALGQQFPYTAYVNAPDVYLRCGPGDNYYPVAKLEHGQKVDIYRHDPGGWYAIKPPEGSFSWVSAEFVEPRQGNLGMVIGEHVVARVGSSFSDTRDVIQVRLDRGEEVEILEAREFNSGPAAQTWYKISPPAGEFRWISGRYVDRQLAEVAPREPSADNNLLLARHRRREPHDAAEHVSDRRRRHREEPADEEAADDWEEIDGDVRPAAHEEPPRRTKAASKKPRRADPEPDDDDAEAEEAADDDERPARLRPEHRRPKANLKEEAADLDFALSAMVIEDPEDWDLRVLKRDAENALARADTALDRGRIRRVLRKIDNFADIQQRHLALMSPRGDAGQSEAASLAASRPLGGLSPLRYDGVGRLTQLTTTLDPRLPQFALIDARGQVAAYVSPAPGVNLRRFLNQEVGINGIMGYLPQRQAQHLTAKRIVPMGAGPMGAGAAGSGALGRDPIGGGSLR